MGSEGRPPEDLQEAVAATLRRLRGEARNQGPARGPRIEPQLSPAPGPAAAPAASAPFTAPPAAPPPAASSPAAWSPPASPPPASPPPASSSSASRAQASAASAARPAAPEPDLLSAFATEIPPSPKARESVRAALAADVEADEGKRPGRHWLRYVAGLIMVAALAGAGWWAYRNFAGGFRSGEVPVVTAEQTPEKVPPTDQPANQAPAQDKTVYNNGISSSSTPQQNGEVLLPQPESPAPPPAPAPAPTAADAAPASGAASSTPPATTGGESAPPVPAPAPSLPTANSTTGSTAETLLPAPSASPSTPPASTSTSSSSSADASSAAAAPPPAPPAPPESAPSAPATGATGTVTTASAAPATSAPPAAKEPTAPGNYRVQLASLKTEADANRTWKRLSTKYKDILGPLSVHLEKADLGTKGTYFRVQAGPFTDKAAAKDVCVKLKAKGQPCLVKP